MMSVLFESWNECGADWRKSSIFLQVTSKDKHKRKGVKSWFTKEQLNQRFGQEGADAIVCFKTGDATLSQSEVRDHPDAPGVEAR